MENKQFDFSGLLVKTDEFENKIINSIKQAVKATTYQNIREGYDFTLTGDLFGLIPYNIKVDLKRSKKTYRTDYNIDTAKVWLEYRNIGGGNGSLLKETDLFAELFKDEHGQFLSFSRRLDRLSLFDRKAREYIKNHNTTLPCRTKDFYLVYQRENRKDILMMVRGRDILELEVFRIYVEETTF
jgi:hypothetical protein